VGLRPKDFRAVMLNEREPVALPGEPAIPKQSSSRRVAVDLRDAGGEQRQLHAVLHRLSR
jgi:hypothetical protein